MSHIKPLIINHLNPQSRNLTHSREPLISSMGLGWQNFGFDYYQYGDFKTPLFVSQHHLISLLLDDNIQTERKLDSLLCKEHQSSGSVAMIPAKVEHWCAWKLTARFVIFSITPEALANLAPETINPHKIELIPTFAKPKPDPLIAGIGMTIKQQLEGNLDNCDFYVEHLKNALLAHLIQNYCTVKHSLKKIGDGLPPYKLKQAIDYINDNLDKQIKLTDIAELIDISQYYFCRLFNESIGVSPYKYVIQQRVAKAKNLIKNSELTLADIAYECGFSSQSQMTQHFRKCVGVTPKVYRNRL